MILGGYWVIYSKGELFPLFFPFHKFSCCREDNVAGRIQCGLQGILDHTDDEADTDDLHGDIIGDTE